MKNNKFKSLFVVFIFLFSISFVYSNNDDLNLDYLYLYLDNSSQVNRVHYEVEYQSINNLKFELKIKHNDVYLENFCVTNLDFSIDQIKYRKITCDVEKKGFGLYEFEAKILDSNGQVIIEKYNKEYILGNSSVGIDFIENENNSTTIILKIKGNDENLVVKNRIPKTVIELLNEENKDELIVSNKEYVIIEEDPLIAWSVDKAPQDINYTINKKISSEEMKNFEVDLTKTSSFKFAKYIIILLLFVVLFFIFKPMFFKKTK